MNDATPAGGLTVWHISDGRRGHDQQCLGLVQALQRLRPCAYYKIERCPLPVLLLALIRGRFPSGLTLPDPDLIIGAGHSTHITLLCAQRLRRGSTVVLMRPSLPTSWFDLCLIPTHDAPPPAVNIITTEGALNRVTPSDRHDPKQGLLLIGGPSRHYRWDIDRLAIQIGNIVDKTPGVRWLLTDSPRTPAATSLVLSQLARSNVQYVSHRDQERDWLPANLAIAGLVWITVDSVSMIYEALTAGPAIGLLPAPARHRHRIVDIPEQLRSRHMVTLYRDWQAGAALVKSPCPLNESARCAALLLEKLGL